MKFAPFKQQNNSIILRTERGFALINLNKVKLIQSSVDFPYLQKRVFAKSFVTLGVFSTTINVLKFILVSSHFDVNSLVQNIIPFLVVQFCSAVFFIVGVKWLRQCRKHKRFFIANSHIIHFTFDDFSAETFTVGSSQNTEQVLAQLFRHAAGK